MGGKVRVVGDPSKLADNVISTILRDAEAKINEAYQAAIKLLKEGFNTKLNEMLNELSDKYSSVSDEIKSYEAIRQAELKLRVSERKSEWAEKVVEKVREKIANMDLDEKKLVYEKLLEDLSRKYIEGETLVIECKKGDKKIIKEAISKLNLEGKLGKKIIVEEKLENALGGFKAYPREKRVIFDYTLDLLLDSLKSKLIAVALDTMFGEGGKS